MGNPLNTPLASFTAALEDVRRNRGWLLTLGILLIILGILALLDSIFVTVVSMFVFGWALIIAGIIEAIQAIRHRKAGHLFLHGLTAVLSIVVGIMLVRHPVAGALVLTLLLGVYFVVVGIFRIVASLALRIHGWGWALTNGIISLILGILVWAQWPVSGLWIIGLFIGIDLIVTGWTEVALAIAVRRPHPPLQPIEQGAGA